MWPFYTHLCNLFINDKGILDEFLPNVAVPLINYMNKDPHNFKIDIFGTGTTPMDTMFTLISRIFKVASEKQDEIEAICAVTLILALLENIPGIDSNLNGIITFLVS